jgi:light-regulated signal transduction histidine kinase (bacteriophytochrome)
MSELIDDMLHLSRVTQTAMKRGPVDMSALARDVVDQLRKASPDRHVQCVIADGVTAEGDEKLLRIALENLMGNAFKFTSKREDARVEFGLEEQADGRRAYFVRDNGAGFDMKYARKLFGAFQRLHSASQFQGTGIGLATVRRIINRHGGLIWAESDVDQGATFYFTL